MSKITFRADDDLVERLETFDASKSEVMRDALRTYLEDAADSEADDAASDDGSEPVADVDAIGDAIAERVDAIIADRLDDALDARMGARSVGTGTGGAGASPQDVNVTVKLDGATATTDAHVTDVEPSEDPMGTEETDVTHDKEAEVEGEDRKTTAQDTSPEHTPSPVEESQPGATETSCKGCGQAMDTGDVYCPNCGEKNSHRAFCECGDEVRTDWGFCPSCGRRTPAAGVLDPR